MPPLHLPSGAVAQLYVVGKCFAEFGHPGKVIVGGVRRAAVGRWIFLPFRYLVRPSLLDGCESNVQFFMMHSHAILCARTNAPLFFAFVPIVFALIESLTEPLGGPALCDDVCVCVCVCICPVVLP